MFNLNGIFSFFKDNKNAKFKVTEQFAQEFEKKCARVDAHGFLEFMSTPNDRGVSLLDIIAKVEDSIAFDRPKEDKNIDLSQNDINNCMTEFFSKYMPQKADEVTQILNKTHPYFIDEDGQSHINFIPSSKEDNRSSNVGCAKNKSCLELNVYLKNTIGDLRGTAHEISHALSAHHQHRVDMLRANDSMPKFRDTRTKFEKDCIGEIESHITENLLNRFLVSKGIYSKSDLKNYENLQQSSLLYEINLIREESDIIKQLHCPVTFEDLDGLVTYLQHNNKPRFVERVQKMHDENGNSPYMFRYVVGRIVSEEWMKKFVEAPNAQVQKDMLDNFQAYLNQTHKLDLDSACKTLLDKDFLHIAKDYVIDKTNEKQIKEKEIHN